ncbi:MAG: very short patch repair endonuclease [Desulfobacteraceae bacterium]|nr:very short patch repair endonuclease [Desulfobacteraceae bacterium]
MADVHTKEQRSYNMSMIKGKDTKPEISLRKLLFAKGVRGYRVHYRLPGKPDIVFPKKKIVVFIDGCFWHKCSKCFIKPQTNKGFWKEKINSNVERDRVVNKQLKKMGWKIIRIWEHEVRKNLNKSYLKVFKEIQRTRD